MSAGLPGVETLYNVTSATWPAAALREEGSFVIRDGQGGGKRVSAATLRAGAEAPISKDDLAQAEAAMTALGQDRLFMIRQGEAALDAQLEAAGYAVIDPTNMYVCPLVALTDQPVPKVTAYDIWEPLAIQLDIWAQGGIGPARVEVMKRAQGPKASLFGREAARPAATGFVAVSDGVAMIHALEVLERHRRRGLGHHLTRHAAHWAAAQGATHLAVLCTQANAGAKALYSSLGMTHVGQYHYRIKTEAQT